MATKQIDVGVQGTCKAKTVDKCKEGISAPVLCRKEQQHLHVGTTCFQESPVNDKDYPLLRLRPDRA